MNVEFKLVIQRIRDKVDGAVDLCNNMMVSLVYTCGTHTSIVLLEQYEVDPMPYLSQHHTIILKADQFRYRPEMVCIAIVLPHR